MKREGETLVSVDLHLHDVEAHGPHFGYRGVNEEVVLRGSDHPTLFSPADGLHGSYLRRAAGAHFDEAKTGAVFCDDVDFPRPTAVVAGQDAIAKALEPARSYRLTPLTQERARGHGSTDLQPVVGQLARRGAHPENLPRA
jgi:hypothetical protein